MRGQVKPGRAAGVDGLNPDVVKFADMFVELAKQLWLKMALRYDEPVQCSWSYFSYCTHLRVMFVVSDALRHFFTCARQDFPTPFSNATLPPSAAAIVLYVVSAFYNLVRRFSGRVSEEQLLPNEWENTLQPSFLKTWVCHHCCMELRLWQRQGTWH